MSTNQQKNLATPEEIWKILREVSESQKETDKLLKELSQEQKKTDQQIKKTDQQINKTDQQMKKTDQRLNRLGGRFDDRWGLMVESLVEGKVVELLQSRGINVYETAVRMEGSYRDKEGEIQKREIDILAANGNEVVAVEVKSTLNSDHIRYFLNTLKNFKKYFHRYKTETVYGAVAYLRSSSEAPVFAEKHGLFVIRATGDSASIINKKDFKPKAF